jgi:uncharacterized membrane protein YgdD (TMEM256/DUF423 family)
MFMLWIRIGALLMLTGVAAGAFGAHALKTRLDEPMRAIFETGVRYQLIHALALFAVAWLSTQTASKAVQAAGWCFTAGILLFSGSLYALSLSGVRAWGAVTPIGGVAFLAGWVCLLIARIR